ncbi:hypothetical protein BHM03_00003090 [Ensete ventricosum]|nr:hypothetical protein BHM03_00003090 [Ensete ventricosum]
MMLPYGTGCTYRYRRGPKPLPLHRCDATAVAALLLLPLILHRPFLFTLFFFLIEAPVCIGIPCVNTSLQTGTSRSDRLPKLVQYPKRQTLVLISR